VEQINQATKIKLIEMMKVNNPKENNQAKKKNTIVCLSSYVKTTQPICSTIFNTLQEILNWVTRINHNSTQVPNLSHGQKTQFDLVTLSEPWMTRRNP
jgi:hypothetical protein